MHDGASSPERDEVRLMLVHAFGLSLSLHDEKVVIQRCLQCCFVARRKSSEPGQ